MSHNLGRLVPANINFSNTAGLDLTPSVGPLGGPRFVILHFDNVSLSAGARLTVDLGYDTDEFDGNSGSSFWSRPVDGSINPVRPRIVGGTGSARLREYGVGEPTITPNPGDPCGSRTNPDVFLHTDPYSEPIYETRLACTPGFAWQNAVCALPSVPSVVRNRVAAATGIIVVVHDGHVSSCTGTLIGSDLFLTARHCLTDATGEDVRSASVTFDYATACDGSRPAGHATRFFKVVEEVIAGSPGQDWVIVRLDGAPGSLPAPLPMRAAALMNGEVIFTMHHPNGAAKKTQAGVHNGGFSINGFDYAGGSSGSALFDVNGQLVEGPLSAGGLCTSSGACSVTYAALAPIRNALANPPAPPKPLDVMIVFDRSGSMASSAPPVGRTKLDEAQDAAALFVQLVREGQDDRLGLVSFSSIASLDRPLGTAATVKPQLIGPAPFTGGDIGAITASGTTSIGGGVGIALLATAGTSTGNDRAMLVLSDGLQNTAPMIEEIEGSLGSTKLCVIGFGSDAEIDGPLLSRIAREHNGEFTRAVDGLTLRKFFGLCFGNIFETGALGDPNFVLKAGQKESEPHKFSVCGEERITLVIGWDNPGTPLRAHIRTPSGQPVDEKRIETSRGRSWAFYRVPLPHNGERDGTWYFTVDRTPIRDDVRPSAGDVRYFFLVVSAGGPKLTYMGGPRRVYTGDPIDPRVGLHYPNGTTPPNAQVELTVEGPGVALGQLVMQRGLLAPSTSADTVDAFHATLQDIARQAGGTLPVPISTRQVQLFDDGSHNDGAMEPDGVFNNRVKDLTRCEGTYMFRAVARYGSACEATREAMWSIHVEPGIDPDRSDVSIVDVIDTAGGRRGTMVVTPRDRFDNPLGPGRPDVFTFTPFPGVTLVGPTKDRGDGSYGVDVVWDPAVTPNPGVVVSQPDRRPMPMPVPPTGKPPAPTGCEEAAGKLLDCLGLPDPEVKRVRVKSVCLEVDLEDDCGC